MPVGRPTRLGVDRRRTARRRRRRRSVRPSVPIGRPAACARARARGCRPVGAGGVLAIEPRSIRIASLSADRIHWTTSAASIDDAHDLAAGPQDAAGHALVADRVGPGQVQVRVVVPADQRAALHDRQAEYRVERRGQDHEQRPGRVRPAAGQRVEPDQRPEEQAADHDEVHVGQVVQPLVLERQPVEAAEVERERRRDVQRRS